MREDSIVIPKVKQIYGDVLCQVFSPCGNFLIAGNIYGQIFVFDLRITLEPADSAQDLIRRPQCAFSLPDNKAAFSAASSDKFFIVGSVGQIFGFEWRSVCSKAGNLSAKVAWCWELPLRKDDIERAEVNSVVVTKDGQVLAGCGDKEIHIYSLEDGRLLTSLQGHTDYIHDLAIMDENQACSASEDGTVRIWDLRMKQARLVLEPWKQSTLQREHLGKWVGAVLVEKEWLLCGGGVRAGLWHLPTLMLTTTFQTEDENPCHAVLIHDDRIFIGDRKQVTEFNLVGDNVSSLASSSNTVMSLKYQENPHRVLALSGTSQYLDICTDMDNRDQIFICA